MKLAQREGAAGRPFSGTTAARTRVSGRSGVAPGFHGITRPASALQLGEVLRTTVPSSVPSRVLARPGMRVPLHRPASAATGVVVRHRGHVLSPDKAQSIGVSPDAPAEAHADGTGGDGVPAAASTTQTRSDDRTAPVLYLEAQVHALEREVEALRESLSQAEFQRSDAEAEAYRCREQLAKSERVIVSLHLKLNVARRIAREATSASEGAHEDAVGMEEENRATRALLCLLMTQLHKLVSRPVPRDWEDAAAGNARRPPVVEHSQVHQTLEAVRAAFETQRATVASLQRRSHDALEASARVSSAQRPAGGACTSNVRTELRQAHDAVTAAQRREERLQEQLTALRMALASAHEDIAATCRGGGAVPRRGGGAVDDRRRGVHRMLHSIGGYELVELVPGLAPESGPSEVPDRLLANVRGHFYRADRLRGKAEVAAALAEAMQSADPHAEPPLPLARTDGRTDSSLINIGVCSSHVERASLANTDATAGQEAHWGEGATKVEEIPPPVLSELQARQMTVVALRRQREELTREVRGMWADKRAKALVPFPSGGPRARASVTA